MRTRPISARKVERALQKFTEVEASVTSRTGSKWTLRIAPNPKTGARVVDWRRVTG